MAAVQSPTSSEYMLGPELGAIIVDRYEGGCDEYGCYSGQGEARFRSGNTYSGEFRRGMMHGRGQYTWISDGTVYEGDFSNNELVGHGRYTWSDGSLYEGGVVGGMRNGHGTFASADGTLVYEGGWQMSKRHGRGEQRYGVGTEEVSSYTGDWRDNCRHGRGTMTFASGNVYEGEWVEDRKEGRGIMNWVRRRERYTGAWKHDLQCGYGEHVWIEERPTSAVSLNTQKQMCNVYRGEWLDGMRHGQGTFMYADGSQHTGQWYRNKKHGPAVFMSDTGRAFEGFFEDDSMLGKIEQDEEHPELSAAVKLKIADILSSTDEATRVAAVRDVERSVLQVNSDLKLLFQHYAKQEATGPRDSTMFTMSMEQFLVFARDCRALAPSTPITVGEVYRMFFRMRRQHAFELRKSLERAMASGTPRSGSLRQPSTKNNSRPPGNASDGDGVTERGDGDGGRDGQRGGRCSSSSGECQQQRQPPLCLTPSDHDIDGGIYDSRRAITFRECVEGIVRLARMLYLHVGHIGNSGGSDTALPVPHGNNTATAAADVPANGGGSGGGVSRSINTAVAHPVTPRTSALARTGTAPIEGGGSLSTSPVGGSNISSSSNNNSNESKTTHDGVAAGSSGGIDRVQAARCLTQARVVQSVNADFKRFVASHLSALLVKLSTHAVVVGGANGGGGRGGGGGKRGGRSEVTGGKGGPGGGAIIAKTGVGVSAGSKRGGEEVGAVESAAVRELRGAEEQARVLS